MLSAMKPLAWPLAQAIISKTIQVRFETENGSK